MAGLLNLRRLTIGNLRYRATRQGVFGGRKGWLLVFALFQVGKLVGQITKRGDGPVVFHERLAPGERFEIVHMPAPPSRRQARRSARRAKIGS